MIFSTKSNVKKVSKSSDMLIKILEFYKRQVDVWYNPDIANCVTIKNKAIYNYLCRKLMYDMIWLMTFVIG